MDKRFFLIYESLSKKCYGPDCGCGTIIIIILKKTYYIVDVSNMPSEVFN